jgi:hypothetical protein
MSCAPLALAAVLGLGACASAPPHVLSEALARAPVATPEEPTRPEEELVRRTLAAAIAAGNVPPERPLVLVRSPFGSARVLPRGTGATFVILEDAEIRRLAGRYGEFLFLYPRVDARDGTRAEVKLFVLPATPRTSGSEVLHCCWGQGDSYEKRDGTWVMTSSVRFDI